MAAIGALKGRLHGGANEKVMDVLRRRAARPTAESWMREALARKERIMGFGHRVYKAGDVRAGILKAYARKAAEAAGAQRWEETAEIIERILAEEKNLFPNLDWPAGRLFHALGLEVPLYTPIFVDVARGRLERALHRATGTQPSHPSPRSLHRAGRSAPSSRSPSAVDAHRGDWLAVRNETHVNPCAGERTGCPVAGAEVF